MTADAKLDEIVLDRLIKKIMTADAKLHEIVLDRSIKKIITVNTKCMHDANSLKEDRLLKFVYFCWSFYAYSLAFKTRVT